MKGLVEITATTMDPAWVALDRGTSGTIAHHLGRNRQSRGRRHRARSEALDA
jgi:hypothetical protein